MNTRALPSLEELSRRVKGAPPVPLLLRTRICEHCGEPYAKPAHHSWARWLKRRFCKPRCVGLSQRART